MRTHVYKKGVLAAELYREGSGTVFRYLPGYLATDAPPVATSLPKSSDPIVHASGAVPPYFAGLLPEGARLSVLRRTIKASADDELSLLLAVGRDTIGDVQVVPAGEDPTGSVPLLDLPAGDIASISLRQVLADAGYDRVALPGVQEKLSMQVINLPGQRAGQSLIVKLDPPEYPHVTANEATFLKLARQVGLSVPDFEFVQDATGEPALLITRFDRRGSERLAMEDASQILGLWPADKYSISYEETVRPMADLAAAAPVARLELFRQIVFAWLTGNGDMHAKNMSLLENVDTGEWEVSPAYDLPSTVPYGDTSLALTIGGRSDGVSRRIMLAFAGDIGLPQRSAIRTLDTLLEKTAPVLTDLRSLALPYSDRTFHDWQRQLDYRRSLLTA